MAKSKKEKLVELDNLILDRMLDALKIGDTDVLTELTPAINYLRNNAVVAEKERSSIEKDTAQRLEAAKKRRAKNESK